MDNFSYQTPSSQPVAPAAPAGNGKKALIFGILSIALNVVGSIVTSIAYTSVNSHMYFVTASTVVTAILLTVLFGFGCNIVGIVFSAIATHTAGRHPVGKAMGGKVTGIIGRVLCIIDLVCAAILVISYLIILA